MGFEPDMRKIFSLLPAERQTMLFSATQTREIQELAGLAFKQKPMYVGVDDARAESTAENIEQGYVMVPADKRFLLLFTFLKKNRKKKIMVWSFLFTNIKIFNYLFLNGDPLIVIQYYSNTFQIC